MNIKLQLDIPEDLGTKNLQKLSSICVRGLSCLTISSIKLGLCWCHYYRIDIVLLLYLRILIISQQILVRARAVRCNGDSYRFLLYLDSYYSSSDRKSSQICRISPSKSPKMNPKLTCPKWVFKLGNTLTPCVMTINSKYSHPYIIKKIHDHPYHVYNHSVT